MNLYPVLLNLSGRNVTVIGGGSVAYRKIKELCATGAHITVISPQFCDEIMDVCATYPENTSLVQREYQPGDLEDAWLVFAATNDFETNNSIYDEVSKTGLWVNIADQPDLCTFHVPAVIRRDDLVVTISTGGASPAVSRKLKEHIEKQLPGDIGPVLRVLHSFRNILQRNPAFKTLDSRQRGEILNFIVNNESSLERVSAVHAKGKDVEFLLKIYENHIK